MRGEGGRGGDLEKKIDKKHKPTTLRLKGGREKILFLLIVCVITMNTTTTEGTGFKEPVMYMDKKGEQASPELGTL